MDIVLQKNIEQLLTQLKDHEAQTADPVARMLIAALTHQTQKILDELNLLPNKVVKRLASTFLPRELINASPSICLVQPVLKIKKNNASHLLNDNSVFSYKVDNKNSLSFLPLLRNNVIPIDRVNIFTNNFLLYQEKKTPLNLKSINNIWVGLELPEEIETLENVSVFIKGGGGIMPQKICVGPEECQLDFERADNLSMLPLMEPFDSQQASPDFIFMMKKWQSILKNEEGVLLYITDPLKNRDIFKTQDYPKAFSQFLESSELDKFEKPNLWIKFVFEPDYEPTEEIEFIFNVMPVINVAINTVTLTSSSPIAKLSKDEDSYFLSVIQTSLQNKSLGFGSLNEEVTIRDFDTSIYDDEALYRDIRNLYNRFVEDYHAFVEFNSLKDGELLRNLRDLVNKIGRSVTDIKDRKFNLNAGTYAMRSISLIGKPNLVKVSYLTTTGEPGNKPKPGDMMENKKDAALEKNVFVITPAEGGANKVSPDMEYELFRYYTLTRDRLFTKMDIEAFLRVYLIEIFGKEEYKRIRFEISLEGAAGARKLTRGMYIDIFFKDQKNYIKAKKLSIDLKVKKIILDKSCLSMPVTVTLKSNEM